MHMDSAFAATENLQVNENEVFENSDIDDSRRIDSIIDGHGAKRASVISILLDIQTEYNYLPKSALERVAKRLEMSMSEIFSIATFYKAFSLKPRGKHVITVCLGTACHVRGGTKIAEAVSRQLCIEPGETTEDMQFTLETVNCLGACALGPVVVVGEDYSGNMSVGNVEKLIRKYRRG